MAEFVGTEQEAKEFIMNGVVSVENLGNRSLKVKCESASIANRIVGAYARIYGGYDHVWDSEFHFLGTDKYAEPKFATTAERDAAKEYTEVLMALKGTGPIDGSHPDLPGKEVVEEDPESEDPDKDNTAIYIIIGAAAAIIILLLLWRK